MWQLACVVGLLSELTAKLVTKPCRGYKPTQELRWEVPGSMQSAWARKAQHCRHKAFFHVRLEEGVWWLHPKAISLCRWRVSLSHFCPASGPAGPDHGQSLTCTLPPKCLVYPLFPFLSMIAQVQALPTNFLVSSLILTNQGRQHCQCNLTSKTNKSLPIKNKLFNSTAFKVNVKLLNISYENIIYINILLFPEQIKKKKNTKNNLLLDAPFVHPNT